MPAPKAPSNYKDPAKIQAYIAKEIEKLRDGKAATEMLCGSVKRAVVLGTKDASGEIHKLLDAVDTLEESVADQLGSFIANEHGERIKNGQLTLFGHQIHRAMHLCVVDLVADGGRLAFASHWMLGNDPAFGYNRMPGYVDPVSLIFGSSDVDLMGVAMRMRMPAPQENAEWKAEFARTLAGTLGF